MHSHDKSKKKSSCTTGKSCIWTWICIILFINIVYIWFFLDNPIAQTLYNTSETIDYGLKNLFYQTDSFRREYNLDKLWIKYYSLAISKKQSYVEIIDSFSDNECINVLQHEYGIIDETDVAAARARLKLMDRAGNAVSGSQLTEDRALFIDITKYYDEIDMFEARFNELKDSVDVFVVIESTMTCSGHKQDRIQFIENLRQYKPYLYYNHYVKHDGKPKIFHYLNDAYKKFTQNSYAYNINWGDNWTGKDVMRTFELEFMTSNSKLFNETIFNITNGARNKNNALRDDDLIIVSDIDEIPRGILLYFFYRKCGKYMNNVYNLPMALDLIQFNYDFGCKISNNIVYDYNKHDISKLEWRHGGIIRYGQFKIDSYQCAVVANELINYDFREISALTSNPKFIFNDTHSICEHMIRSLRKIRHYEYIAYSDSDSGSGSGSGSGSKNKGKKRIKHKPITIHNAGWHLSSFYANYSKSIQVKLVNAADPWKNTKFTRDHIECYREQCVDLKRERYSFRDKSKARKYFNANFEKNDLESNATLAVRYPQFIVEQAMTHSSHYWFKMFPQKNGADNRIGNDNNDGGLCKESLIRDPTWMEYLLSFVL